MSSLKSTFTLLLLFSVLTSEAVRIQFPDEELASEAVLPIFQPRNMVLDRRVSLKNRFELGATISFGLDEPFYYPIYGTGLVAFYISEIHGFSLTGTYFYPDYSFSGRALKEGNGLRDGKTFDVQKVPYPQMMGFLNYKYVPYYGKISLTKQFVLNLSIYGYIGPGLMIFNHGTKQVAGNMGFGQKLYFNKWFALRGDIGFYFYRGPNPARINLGKEVQEMRYNQIPAEDKRMIFNLIANMGVVLLI